MNRRLAGSNPARDLLLGYEPKLPHQASRERRRCSAVCNTVAYGQAWIDTRDWHGGWRARRAWHSRALVVAIQSCSHSIGDRTRASGARDAGSIPAGSTSHVASCRKTRRVEAGTRYLITASPADTGGDAQGRWADVAHMVPWPSG